MGILLESTTPIVQESITLFSNWEFWAFILATAGGLITVHVTQTIAVNTLKIQMESLKEQVNRDRKNVQDNYQQLFDICTDINKRLSNMEGFLTKQKK